MTDDASLWIRMAASLPPEGQRVMTKIEDAKGTRNVGVLRLKSGLWWADDIYVYYTPTHWRRLRAGE